MNKIGRNDPCPCGSGKKFKKCCIDKLHSPNTQLQLNETKNSNQDAKHLDEMIEKGYRLLEREMAGDACSLWLEAWEYLKERLPAGITSIKEAERIFSGEQFLSNWCQDLETELANAGQDDISFYDKRIKYCREICSLLPETASMVIHNMKRAEAESYFALGNLEQGEQCFENLVKEYPKQGWGYIGWGDMYWLFRLNDKIPVDKARAEMIYRMALDNEADEKEEVLKRLKDLKRPQK